MIGSSKITLIKQCLLKREKFIIFIVTQLEQFNKRNFNESKN